MNERLSYDFHEYASLFPLLNDTDLAELTDDIRRSGLLEDIVLYEGKILDGRNRYLACRAAGVEPRFTEYTGHDALAFVWSMNGPRRHLTSSQRAVIALDMLPYLEAQARERQLSTLKQGSDNPVPQTIAEREGEAREQAAAYAKTNRQYVSDAKKIAEEAPDLLPLIHEGDLSIPKAKKKIADRKREQKREHLKTVSFEEAVQGRFSVIYADPPWEYSNSGFDQSAAAHYKTMATDAICDMPVEAHATDDAVLFLWATSPLLPDAFRVMAAWGFEYKAGMVWVKNRAPGKGWWVQTYHEHLLIGARGSFLPDVKLRSVFEANVTDHSAKPHAVYDMIEQMYPGFRYLELFARNTREGWEAFGDEV